MNPVTNEILRQQLQWRYATKKFDATLPIPEKDWETLEEALVLTPSSYGLQPWKFIVVTDQAIKAKLFEASWKQAQVVDCSHLVAFAIKKDFTLAQVDQFIDRTAEIRNVPRESLAGFRGYIIKDIIEGPRSKHVNDWASHQVYIALGNFMTCAAMIGIDTCPMEGIEPARYDEILGCRDKGLATIVACAAGYRSNEDKYAKLSKVRFPKDDVIER